jgi:hypothetical protein
VNPGDGMEELDRMEAYFAEATRRNSKVEPLDSGFLRERDVERFRSVVERDGSESAIDHHLRGCPDLWSAFLHINATGHHGGQVLSQTIRPAVKGVAPGLIPDYLISGSSSDGVHWWVVELKAANTSIFSGKGRSLRLSDTANRGIIQLLGYLDFCAENQSTLRDAFKLEKFREPKGILLIGREGELARSEERQRMKAIWNRSNHLLEIRTYDSFLRSLDHKLHAHGFRPTEPPPVPGDHETYLRSLKRLRGYRRDP